MNILIQDKFVKKFSCYNSTKHSDITIGNVSFPINYMP